MFGELRNGPLSKQAGSGDAAAYRTRWGFGGNHTVAADGAGILGQDVELKFKVGRDELQHTRLILADACLEFLALRAKLVGLEYVMLDAHLSQAIVIGLARSAWLCRRPGITPWRLRRQR